MSTQAPFCYTVSHKKAIYGDKLLQCNGLPPLFVRSALGEKNSLPAFAERELILSVQADRFSKSVHLCELLEVLELVCCDLLSLLEELLCSLRE